MIGFDSESVYNEKYLKTEIKSCEGKISANFHNDKVPKEDSQWICLSVILVGSFLGIGKDLYIQVFLEECKYILM